MIDAYERFVLIYDMALRTARKATELPELSEMVDALVRRIKDGKSLLVLEPQSEGQEAPWLRIKDAQIFTHGDGNEEYLGLLFSIGDPRGANPVFEHSDTAELREVERLEKEGKALTAHCVIALKSTGFNRYKIVLEDVRGLGKTRFREMLARELKIISEEMQLEYTNNAGEQVSTYIIPSVEGHADEKLKASLERGTISGVWLVDTTRAQTFDEVPGARVSRREIKFEVKELPVIERLKQWGKDNAYDRMRLTWNDPEGTGKPERASVEITQKDVAETYFVKQCKVKLEEKLPEAVGMLRGEMVRQMIALVR